MYTRSHLPFHRLLRFHMYRYFTLVFLSVCLSAAAQQGFPQYYRLAALSAQGDSLYAAGNFKLAAQRYEAAAQITLEKAIDYDPALMYYNAACAHVRAKNPTTALKLLEKLIYEHQYSDAAAMEGDEDLKPLQSDKKWAALIAAARKNEAHKTAISQSREKRLTIDPKVEEVVFHPLSKLAESLLEQDSLPYLSLNLPNFRVYFAADGYAASQLTNVKIDLEDAFNRAITVLDIPFWKKGYHVILVNSLDEMALVSGMRVKGGVALPGHDLMILPYRPERRPQLRHEFFHLLTHDYWGPTNSRLLNEGSAVYADDQCHIENPIANINAQLYHAGKLVPLDRLINHFDEEALKSDVVAYLQSAGIFKYLFEKHGSAKMQALWQQGFVGFEKIYGQTLTAFEAEWLAYIQALPPSEAVDLDMLLREGCG
jgi:hypothetical protein